MILIIVVSGLLCTVFLSAFLLSCWYSIPYDLWVERQREKRKKKPHPKEDT